MCFFHPHTFGVRACSLLQSIEHFLMYLQFGFLLHEGLVKFVEKTVRLEHALSPNKPIYLVGDSFGGCLALAVAARNPQIDLVLILANPGQISDTIVICSRPFLKIF